jgi:hypothetical protein
MVWWLMATWYIMYLVAILAQELAGDSRLLPAQLACIRMSLQRFSYIC